MSLRYKTCFDSEFYQVREKYLKNVKAICTEVYIIRIRNNKYLECRRRSGVRPTFSLLLVAFSCHQMSKIIHTPFIVFFQIKQKVTNRTNTC